MSDESYVDAGRRTNWPVGGRPVSRFRGVVYHRPLRRCGQLVDAFLAASRGGDLSALLAVLDPNVVLRADASAVPRGTSRLVRGAAAVAKGVLAFSGRARFAQPALVNGAVGVVVAPRGRLFVVLGLTVRRGKIVENRLIADPDRLRHLDLGVLDG